MEYTTNKISEATALTSAGEFNADMVMSTIIISWAFGGVNVFRTTEVPKDLRKDVIIFNITDSTDGIMFLDKLMPFEKVLFASKNPKAKGIFFVIYQAQDKTWVCETVPTKEGESYSRKHFPLDWLGASARLLQEITGVRTAWSCDPNGKFCTTVYKEDAIALANLVMSEE